MRFSLRLNNDLTLPEYLALAQAAEEAGFDQFWVSNDLFLRSAPVILAAVAGAADFLGWVGLPQTRPLAEMRATITTIRAMLRGERGPFAGPFGQWTEDAYLRFAAPRVTPIYLGAMSPGMLRL